jgi:hypothetical protein
MPIQLNLSACRRYRPPSTARFMIPWIPPGSAPSVRPAACRLLFFSHSIASASNSGVNRLDASALGSFTNRAPGSLRFDRSRARDAV